MRRTVTAAACAAALTTALTAVSSAAVVENDFDSENGGVTALNYTGFSNLDVIGQVDLKFTPDFGITCAGGGGGCVDLDGSAGPGGVFATLPSPGGSGVYAVSLSFVLSGNQRGGADDEFIFGIAFNGAPLDGIPFTVASDAPFQSFGLVVDFVTAVGAWTGFVRTTSGDSVGPILDNFRFDVSDRTDLPSPSGLAFLALGLGALGFARCR